MNKAELRTLLSRRLGEVNDDELAAASRSVCEQLRSVVDWRMIKRLHVYEAQAKWREIDINGHLNWLRSTIPSLEIITGPPEPEAILPRGKFDVIVVPLLGFDDECRRLGRGRGWYDNFLGLQPQARKIGVALEEQRVEMIPFEPHDVALDIVISDRAVYSRRST